MTIMKPIAAGGGATLGRIFNVLGEPVENLGPVAPHSTSGH